MNKEMLTRLSLALVTSLFALTPAWGMEGEIKITGRKDRVLDAGLRANILSIARDQIADRESDFSETVVSLEDPYSFKEIPAPVEVVESEVADAPVEEPEAPALVVYDDESVLDVVAASFQSRSAAPLRAVRPVSFNWREARCFALGVPFL